MSWTDGLYFSKREEASTRKFLEAQELDERQITTLETFIRQKIVSAVYLYTCAGAGLAVLIFVAGIYMLD